MEQLIAHLVGDFILQTDKQAMTKKHDFKQALIHSITYTIPFLFITLSIPALLVICLTHAIIDHNKFIEAFRRKLNGTTTETGFAEERPAFITIWINIIADNTLHLLINYLAIKYLGGL